RPHPARRQPEDAAERARQGHARRALHHRRARAAHARVVIRMNTRRIAAIGLRQFFLIRGSITRTVPLFVWVAIDIVLWGFITKYLNTVASPGFDFVPVLL